MRRVLLLVLGGLALAPVAGCREAHAQGIPGSLECWGLEGECSSIAGHPPEGGAAPSCPDIPADATVHYAFRLETAYSNNDPISSSTDQGTQGLNATQGTGTAQPTFLDPCEEGKLNDLPCGQGDGGDILTTSTITAQAQPSLLCAVIMMASADTSGTFTYFSGSSATTEHEIQTVNATPLVRGGGNLFAGTVTADTYHVVCGHLNGASSQLWLDGTSIATGNAGAESFAGANLFAQFGGSRFVNGRIVEVVYYDTVGTAADMVAEVMTSWECTYGEFPVAASLESRPAPKAPTMPGLAVSLEMKTRILRYALVAHRRGVPLETIVSRIAARVGHTEAEVREAAKRAFGRRDREPETRSTERVGLLIRNADVATVAEAYAQAACAPLVDEDAPEAAACLTDERKGFDFERYCRVSDGLEVGRGARWMVTSGQWADFTTQWGRLSSTVRNRSVVVRNADDAAYLAAQQAAGVERCPEDP